MLPAWSLVTQLPYWICGLLGAEIQVTKLAFSALLYVVQWAVYRDIVWTILKCSPAAPPHIGYHALLYLLALSMLVNERRQLRRLNLVGPGTLGE